MGGPTVWARTGLEALRFGLVGIAATAVHFVVALAYLTATDGTALAANLLGFAVAFSVSLWGNLLWVFPGRGRSNAVVWKFLAVSLLVVTVTAAISWTFDSLRYDPRLALPVTLLVGPIVSFCGNKLWVFAR